jgi:hypothetical protein
VNHHVWLCATNPLCEMRHSAQCGARYCNGCAVVERCCSCQQVVEDVAQAFATSFSIDFLPKVFCTHECFDDAILTLLEETLMDWRNSN